MQDPIITEFLRAAREGGAQPIDGSFILCTEIMHPAYIAAAHPAYTPDQIEAEWAARSQSRMAHVLFIRDESLPAPYWISPLRRRASKEGVFHVFDVARSREVRKDERCEVAIADGDLRGKTREQRAQFVLNVLRQAIAGILSDDYRPNADGAIEDPRLAVS